jgi:pimeloyl-ACP methyl ester carboxylesterase
MFVAGITGPASQKAPSPSAYCPCVAAARLPLLPGFEERWTDAKSVRMRYFVGGDGPPLVLLHGLTGAAPNWVELAPALARTRRVLVPELPGHGASAALPAAPSLDAYADRVRLVAEREAVLPAPFVGHSLGGLIALRLAVSRADSVAGVVLAAAAGISSSTRAAELWLAFAGFTRPARKVAPFRRSIARRRLLRDAVFGRFEVGDSRSLSPEAVEGLLGSSRLHTDVISAGKALVRGDPRLDLERVRCPCLVLWGARDRQVPVADAFEYARRLRAPLRLIADCGHLLIAERPEACAAAIEDFLDGLAVRGQPV